MATVLPPPEGMHPLEILRDEVKIFEQHFGVVLYEQAYIWFDIDYIKKNREERAFQSPFFELKDVVNKYQGDKMLIVRDWESKYGEKFLLCLTKEKADEEIQKVRLEVEAKEAAKAAELARLEEERLKEEELANRVYEDLPIPVRPYISETVEETMGEVNKLSLTDSRPTFRVNISRKRQEFGAAITKFNETDADNAAFTFFRQHKDPNFTLVKKEVDIGLQDCPGLFSGKVDVDTQTNWFQKMNTTTQYEPVELGKDSIEDILSQKSFLSFLNSVRPKLEEALQQNEIIDLFSSNFVDIEVEDDLSLGNKGENIMKEIRTFTDLNLSKNMTLPCLDWHPERSGIVSVACNKPLTFDGRVKISGAASNAYVIVWNFQDYTPHLVLESPHEITIFKYNPITPNIIAAGCTTGQVLFWDLSAALNLLQKRTKGTGDDPSRTYETPIVKHVYMSSIDKSHSKSVSDLHWLPGMYEIEKDGSYTVSPNSRQNQFLSCADDGVVHVWDLRFETLGGKRKKGQAATDGEPLAWVPSFSYPLNALDGSGTLPVTKMCIAAEGSKFFCGTHSGDILAADWSKVSEDGNPEHVSWVTEDHHRPCSALQRSPHFNDILLSVGDYSFNIWKDGQQLPIFSSNIANCTLTTGVWSPTRPGVLFIGKTDGNVDVWDLTDQSHKPSFNQPVSNGSVTCMMFRRAGDTLAQQILAVGDEFGNLHILDIPRNLRRPINNELAIMTAYIDREVQRVKYSAQRNVTREVVNVKHEEEHLKIEEVTDDPEAISAHDREDELLEISYRRMEAEFKQKFKGNEENKETSMH